MTPSRRLRFGALLATALACGLAGVIAPRAALASYEEFESLDVGRQEEDDENLLDHVLVEPPLAWADEWEQARNAFRTSQGCFTSGQWYLDHQLKFRAPMGDTTYFELGIREVSDDEAIYGWTQLDLRFPIPHAGLWGLRFRPTFDKSQQDAALLWDHGTATTPLQMKVVLGIEDVFNELWALRQTRVGDDAEPYERHPYEPALHVLWRGSGPRVDISGHWLTPSRKRFETLDLTQRRRERLWGARGDASVAQRIGSLTVIARAQQVQSSRFAVWEQRTGDHHQFARRWRTELAVSHRMGERGRITARWFYQERTQTYRPPIANATLTAIDRMPMIDGEFRAGWALDMRTGLMRNRVTVVDPDKAPVSPYFTFGTRVETRAFVSIGKQFGRVRLQGTECIELDHEIYPVAFHHDKGFIHLQTTF